MAEKLETPEKILIGNRSIRVQFIWTDSKLKRERITAQSAIASFLRALNTKFNLVRRGGNVYLEEVRGRGKNARKHVSLKSKELLEGNPIYIRELFLDPRVLPHIKEIESFVRGANLLTRPRKRRGRTKMGIFLRRMLGRRPR